MPSSASTQPEAGLGCDHCRGYWANTNRTEEPLISLGLAHEAMVFQCRICRTFWVDTAGGYPRIESEEAVHAEYPELFEGLERPDDGTSWVR